MQQWKEQVERKSTTTLQTGEMHNEGQDESNRPEILGQNQANTSKGAHLPSNKGGKIWGQLLCRLYKIRVNEMGVGDFCTSYVMEWRWERRREVSDKWKFVSAIKH